MELSNQNRLNSKIQTYYIYSAFEMLIVIGFSVLQLKMIEKLLNKGSIVWTENDVIMYSIEENTK